MNDNDYIDANTYTRAESVSRLNFGPRFEREESPKWGQDQTT